jgi:hypothetical protein
MKNVGREAVVPALVIATPPSAPTLEPPISCQVSSTKNSTPRAYSRRAERDRCQTSRSGGPGGEPNARALQRGLEGRRGYGSNVRSDVGAAPLRSRHTSPRVGDRRCGDRSHPVLVIDADVESGGWQRFADVANWVIWAVFLTELALVLVVAPRKSAALRAHSFDVALVAVTVPVFGSFLSSLRLARLARLLRLLRLGMLAARALQAERRLTSGTVFRFVALITVFVVVVAGAVESLVDKGDFPTLWDVHRPACSRDAALSTAHVERD